MDPQVESDEEFIVLSTSDYANSESTSHPKNVEPFIKPFSFLPSLLRGSFKISGISEARTRKYSEIKPRRQATEHTVNKYYSYHITGGSGGSGGEGHNQGGDGGVGQGPTVYFGQPQEREQSEFQRIRLGDIKLIKEFKEMHSSSRWSVAGRQTPRTTVRRVYKAKLEGPESGYMTVAMYEGDGAEETWNQHLANYESIRHPNIIQLYGLVSAKRLYAMVFHDELIPYDQFLRRFEHSSVLTTYIIAYCQIMKDTEFNEASDYIADVFRDSLIDSSVWIRSATGELCLDLAQGGPSMGSRFQRWWWPDRRRDMIRLENLSLNAPDSEDMIISSLREDQYYKLCSQLPIAQSQYFQVSTEHPIGPGIFQLDSQYGTQCVRITEPLQILPQELHWDNYTGGTPGELLPNSWIRLNFHGTSESALQFELRLSFLSYEIQKAWLAQANRIFAELEEEARVEDYVCISYLQFSLRIANKHHIPEGYLFACPPRDFHTSTESNANLYQWPACPAYWSLDPSGADCLRMEDANNLGFPAIHIETVVGKGFNPESQEVARQLGYPLFEVLSDRVLFPACEAAAEKHTKKRGTQVECGQVRSLARKVAAGQGSAHGDSIHIRNCTLPSLLPLVPASVLPHVLVLVLSTTKLASRSSAPTPPPLLQIQTRQRPSCIASSSYSPRY
ncbi:hypothetical protein MSAN_01515400 [Mycena sanguinolenta]|uniref:Protein kinase domain-containing protein n=1 Tax=Mycena sanguinolenta TaxID=230812 RepID=A0A8H7CWU8_9AGAR|nr:hypothetical protein MSAN_01515400 [Mycena sanguinolenta]